MMHYVHHICRPLTEQEKATRQDSHDVCGSHERGQVKRKSRMARSKERMEGEMEEKVTRDSESEEKGEDYYRTEGERMKKAKAAIVARLSAREEKLDRSKVAMDRKEQEMKEEITRMKEKWEKLYEHEGIVLEGLEVVREDRAQLNEEKEGIQKEMEIIKNEKRQIAREINDLRRQRVQAVSYRQMLEKEEDELREERLEMKDAATWSHPELPAAVAAGDDEDVGTGNTDSGAISKGTSMHCDNVITSQATDTC
ncbi:hypothetical protein J4Q44_G00018620 [Coregonus suidteri]|uniref:Uncharacterized protein n=1 Tax=Coregonus suidteri TaxID=861788 RepID=A0AAN8MFX0_9TELE